MALKIEAATEKKSDDKKSLAPASSSLEILAAIKKSKGDKVVVRGDQIGIPRRLPTGIFELDFYLGGGFPRGRYSIIYGPESSCKTNVALKAAAMAQKGPASCNKVVWANIEQSFDPAWATKMGVDVSKLLVIEPGYGEEAIDMIDGLVRASDVALVVVDSMAALIANKEVAQSVENYDIGSSALLIKRFVNKLMIAFGECRKHNLDPCVLLINQTRFKPGVQFGDPETMPGGEAQKFLSSLRVRFYGKNVVDKKSSTLVFKDVHAVVKKAKIPIRAVDFDFQLCVTPFDGLEVGDTDSFNMVKSHLQSLSLLTKTTQGYKVSFNDKKSQMFPTLTAMAEKYQTDHTFRRVLQALVIENYHEKMVFVEEVDPNAPKDVPPGKIQPVEAG